MPPESFLCDMCAKTFTKKFNLLRHFKFIHSAQENQNQGRFTCCHCNKEFNKKFNLVRHIEQVHRSQPKEVIIYNCPMCTFSGPKVIIVSHYNIVHEINISTRLTSFLTVADFEKWKDELETEACSKHIKHRVKESQYKIQYFYRCHRDGFYKPEGKNIRALKIMGTNKINGHCPAKIIATVCKNTEKVSVQYCNSHVGHKLEIGRLTLSKLERQQIAQEIAKKIPFKEILNKIRNSISNYDISRLHLLTRKDLLNIESMYNLNNDAIRDANDYTSVDAWVKETQEHSGDSIVRLYKKQGVFDDNFPTLQKDDFLLMIMNVSQIEMLQMYGGDCICIDSTHGMNPYDFQLSTLLVLDDLRQGFPCTFIFSNRTDETLFKIVFDAIAHALEHPLHTKVFMSDLAQSFYNAWQLSMGPVETRIFCSWHVDKAWRKNINEKIANLEDRVEIYKVVRTLLEETDQVAFEKLLFKAVKTMLRNPNTYEFGKYFENYYCANKMSWAYCYRLYSGINTNMHLESMHKVLKYIYLEGRKVKRLDKAVHAILNFIRDKLFDRLITLNRGKLTKKISELRKRHKRATEVKDQCIIMEDNGTWTVSSASGADIYQIKPSTTNFICNCNIKCTQCAICIHSYRCSCPDSSISWNMCKHVHLLGMFLKGQLSTIEEREDIGDMVIDCDPRTVEENIILKSLKNPLSNESHDLNNNVDAAKSNTIRLFNEIMSMVTTVEENKFVEKALLPLPHVLSSKSYGSNVFINTDFCQREPSNKHIEPQRGKKRKNALGNTNQLSEDSERVPEKENEPKKKFISTKNKKSTKKLSLKKPSKSEKNNISISLFHNADAK